MNTRMLTLALLMILALPVTISSCRADAPVISPISNDIEPIPDVLVLPGAKNAKTQLIVSPARIAPGQSMSLRFVVRNNGRKTVRYSFPTGQEFDIFVTDSKGETVWRWSEGKSFSGRLTGLALRSGESAAFHATWPGLDARNRPVPAGDYAVFAQMTPDLRPGITGGIIVNTDTDPSNTGFATAGPAQTGAIREVPSVAPAAPPVKVTVVP